MSRPELNLILEILDQSYDKKSWHGPSLRGAIRSLNVHQAVWRPAKDRHNIWEHVVHTAYWKYVVRRRLLGEKKGSFPLRGSNWFERPATSEEIAWRTDVALLDEMHRSLRAAVADLAPEDLRFTPAGSMVSNVALLTGIAAHDVYHAGQIQLLKRLNRSVSVSE
jgi:hypothetical protein